MKKMMDSKHEGQIKKEIILYSQIIAFFIVVNIFLVLWSNYDWVRVPLENTQMTPTFREYNRPIGKRVSVGRHAKESQQLDHGDVVYYAYPNDFLEDERETLFFARVIGLPGDTIGFSKGKIVRNGELLEEAYVTTETNEILPEIIVPKNHVYILNDNREAIGRHLFYSDSRYMGPISMYAVKGVLSD